MNAPFLAPLPFRQRRLGGRRRDRRRGRRVGGSPTIASPACGRGKGRGRHLGDRRVLGCDRKRLLHGVLGSVGRGVGRNGYRLQRRIGGLGGVIRLDVVRLGRIRLGGVRFGLPFRRL